MSLCARGIRNGFLPRFTQLNIIVKGIWLFVIVIYGQISIFRTGKRPFLLQLVVWTFAVDFFHIEMIVV